MKNNIKGVGVALITPFTTTGAVDFKALTSLVDYVSNNGVDYLVALGTTAETPTLSASERHEIVACIKERNAALGQLPMIIGVGGNNTAEVIHTIAATDFNGTEGVLSVTPYYNKPSQRGMFEHYKAVAAESPVPVLLYNVPSRTGVNMTAETTLKIAHEVPNVMGIKEACGVVSQMAHILQERPSGFKVISGDDIMSLPLISLGGDGVISVAANAFPKVFTEMIAAGFAGNIAGASALQMRLLDAIEALFVEGNPTGVKCALTARSMIENNLRLPLVSGSDELLQRFKMLIAKYNL